MNYNFVFCIDGLLPCNSRQMSFLPNDLNSDHPYKITRGNVTQVGDKNNHLIRRCGYNLFLEIQAWRRLELEGREE